MSFIGTILHDGTSLPRAYGGCTCHCHRAANVYHIMPCCYPTDEDETKINVVEVKSDKE